MAANRHGLGFLISIGGLPIACAPENDALPGTETGTTGTGEASTSGVGSTETGVLTSGFLTNNPDTGSSEDTGATPPPENPPCIAYYNTLLGCFPEEGVRYAAYHAAYCDMALVAGLRADGQMCAAAITAAFTCLSNLSCAFLVDEAPHCVDETQAAEDACPMSLGPDETGTSGTTG